jgi:hypothetical protein
MTDPILVFAIFAVAFALLVIVILLIRMSRTQVKDPAPAFIDEAVTDLHLEAWSPTRGHYTFRTADLPPEYQGLPGIAGTTLVKQSRVDVSDARARLLGIMLRKRVEGGRRMVFGGATPRIAAEPVSFKPLLKRKGQK